MGVRPGTPSAESAEQAQAIKSAPESARWLLFEILATRMTVPKAAQGS